MNKILYLVLSLCCFSACQKRAINPSIGNFSISIDSSVGSVVLNHSGDTFLVSLRQPSMISAVPLIYHLSPGAVASVGIRQQINWLHPDNAWRDTVDLAPNNVHMVTVTSENGKTHEYGIAFQYIVERYDLPEFLYHNFIYDIFFAGDSMYIATEGGLTMSADGGESYTQYSIFGPGDYYRPGVNCVYVSGQYIYAGIDDGVAVSSDGGKTFTTHRYVVNNGYGWIVSDIDVQGDTVYAVSNRGMLISRDRGASFDTTMNGASGFDHAELECVSADGGTVYAGSWSGLFISHDGGHSFKHDDKLGPEASDLRVYDIFIRNGGLYLGTSKGLYISRDGGNSFENGQSLSGTSGIRLVAGYENNLTLLPFGSSTMFSPDDGQSFAYYSYDVLGLGFVVNAVTARKNSTYFGGVGFFSIVKPR